MARMKLIRSQIFPYHVTLRSNNREWFKLPLEKVWQLTTDELCRISLLFGVNVHSYVLMSNHLHMMLSTPEKDLGFAMCEFGGSMTRMFNLISGRTGHLFGGPYRWSIVQTPLYYANAMKYVYRNPVRAGLVDRVEDYRFSSLTGVVGTAHMSVLLHHPQIERLTSRIALEDPGEMLKWLNEPFCDEVQAAIAKGLRRKVFELPRDPASGSKTALDRFMVPGDDSLLPKK